MTFATMAFAKELETMALNQENMQEIVPGLFLGNCVAPSRLHRLSNKDLWSVLSIGDFHKPQCILQLAYMNINVLDMSETNLIQHFNDTFEFINKALESNRIVLVHCHAGVSRSATIVAAYLMRSKDLSVDEALKFIRSKRPNAQPNEGFLKQLKLYEELKYNVDIKYTAYRQFITAQMAKKKTASEIIENFKLSPDPATSGDPRREKSLNSGNTDPAKTTKTLRCRKCRRVLANSENIIDHEPGPGQVAFQYLKRDSELNISEVSTGSGTATLNQPLNPLLASLAASKVKCSLHFIEPMEWISGLNDRMQRQGKIECPSPKCKSKLGSYDWSGMQCSCGKWITPAFMLHRKQIDE